MKVPILDHIPLALGDQPDMFSGDFRVVDDDIVADVAPDVHLGFVERERLPGVGTAAHYELGFGGHPLSSDRSDCCAIEKAYASLMTFSGIVKFPPCV
jgi:hypothetical protein